MKESYFPIFDFAGCIFWPLYLVSPFLYFTLWWHRRYWILRAHIHNCSRHTAVWEPLKTCSLSPVYSSLLLFCPVRALQLPSWASLSYVLPFHRVSNVTNICHIHSSLVSYLQVHHIKNIYIFYDIHKEYRLITYTLTSFAVTGRFANLPFYPKSLLCML